jgi:hypothetical protein
MLLSDFIEYPDLVQQGIRPAPSQLFLNRIFCFTQATH